MAKRIVLVTVIVTVVTEVGKRKAEDAGVRERQSEREGTRKYTCVEVPPKYCHGPECTFVRISG